MFTHIRTSKENKEVVTQLTRKYNLGAENVIARIAIAYSLAEGDKLDFTKIQNSGGKEYSRSVLFGDKEDIYIGIICTFYDIHKNREDLGKYLKLHLDDGLNRLAREKKGIELIDFFAN